MALTIAKLHSNGDMDINQEIIEITASWDDSIGVDENYMLDEDKSFPDDQEVKDFVNHIFNTENEWADIDHFHFKSNDGNLYTNNFVEDDTSEHPMKLTKDGGVTIKGEVREYGL